MIWERELKWGNCHAKWKRKSTHGANGLSNIGVAVTSPLVYAGSSISNVETSGDEERSNGKLREIGVAIDGSRAPPHADHPMSGGIAPTTAPTHVLITWRLFRAV